MKPSDKAEDVTILALNQPLDQYSQQAYESAFRRFAEEGDLKKRIILVLRSVNRINNIGLNLLLQFYEQCKEEGRTVVLAQLSEPVHRYLKMLGYVDYLPVTGSIAEAILALSRDPGSSSAAKV